MPSALPSRQLKHTRAISIDAYVRDDGMWDLEAHLTDTKTRDIQLASGVRPSGEPIHDMHLTVTIDRAFNIIAVHAVLAAVPYIGYCETIQPSYQALVGLNLMRNFRHEVRQRLGGTSGCTHMTELSAVLPTAAVQAFAGEVVDPEAAPLHSHRKPFQLDRCHSLRTDGPAVREFYPAWYRPAGGDASPGVAMSDDDSKTASPSPTA